ncbi:MAG TPA: NAD(P)H-dependent oxidoreductase subunit E [Ignavibacteria bacterium]|nr:NAD(P)H-dependent oxidoreductase subunit E [Ignavibacteria bacterium]HRK00301.1 NAD(P)H-dependent oxidoreductase subunit E [Ignavibacteria bacterium]
MKTQEYTPMFDESEMQTVKMHISKYPKPMAAVMPLLWMIQEKYGWISVDAMRYVGDLLSIPHDHVLGVATFYSMYFKKPMGKFHLQICTNVSCMLCDGYKIFNHISDKLGIKNKEITPDGMFSIEEVECLGSCATAPMLLINNKEFHENLTIEKTDELLAKLRNSN